MTENSKTRPTHTIYKVTGDGDATKWIKVGVAFAHKDEKGLALIFDGIPVQGRIAVRKNKPTVASEVAPSKQVRTAPAIHLPKPKPVHSLSLI